MVITLASYWSDQRKDFQSCVKTPALLVQGGLVFKDPRNTESTEIYNTAKIDGILFLDDFAILNYPLLDGQVKHLTLFKKVEEQYIKINTVTDPALGTE